MPTTNELKSQLNVAKLAEAANHVATPDIDTAGSKQIQSVSRALTILELLATEGDALPLKELASRAQLNQSHWL